MNKGQLSRLLQLDAARNRSKSGELNGSLEEEFWTLRDEAYDTCMDNGIYVEADSPRQMVETIRRHGLAPMREYKCKRCGTRVSDDALLEDVALNEDEYVEIASSGYCMDCYGRI